MTEHVVVERIGEVNPLVSGQHRGDSGPNVRVGVHRVDDRQILKPPREVDKCLTDAFQADAEALPPVAGHKHDQAVTIHDPGQFRSTLVKGVSTLLARPLECQPQRVDCRVPRHDNPFSGDPFPLEVVGSPGGRCKVVYGKRIDQVPVHLLRERAVTVPGAQASFDVTHRNLPVVGCQARDEGRRRVAVNEYQVRGRLQQQSVQTLDQTRRQACQVLARAHDIKINVGLDLEESEHLVEHLAMLRRDEHQRLDGRFRPGIGTQLTDDRGHLDRFRSRTKDHCYSHASPRSHFVRSRPRRLLGPERRPSTVGSPWVGGVAR